jgi:hypothetical protein
VGRLSTFIFGVSAYMRCLDAVDSKERGYDLRLGTERPDPSRRIATSVIAADAGIQTCRQCRGVLCSVRLRCRHSHIVNDERKRTGRKTKIRSLVLSLP